MNCQYPGCKNDAQIKIGVAFYNKRTPQQIIGPICNEHSRTSIENVMDQCLGSKLWVIILDLNDKLLYHSYDADQDGIMAALGWELKAEELNISKPK